MAAAKGKRRWLFRLALIVLVVGLGWLVLRALRSGARSPLDASSPPTPELLVPAREPVGVAACDDYVKRVCGCTTDAPAMPGSAAARCKTAGLLATTWREQRASRSLDDAELGRRCQRLLEALAELEPACAPPTDGGAPAGKVDK